MNPHEHYRVGQRVFRHSKGASLAELCTTSTPHPMWFGRVGDARSVETFINLDQSDLLRLVTYHERCQRVE